MIDEIRLLSRRLGISESGLLKLARECAEEDAPIIRLELAPARAIYRLRDLLADCWKDKLEYNRRMWLNDYGRGAGRTSPSCESAPA